MTLFDDFKSRRVGKVYAEDKKFGYQCVALAKLFVSEVNKLKLKSFGGSAINGRQTGSPFFGLPFVRVVNNGTDIPPRGAVLFFKPTKANQYGHVAIAGKCNTQELRVIEQNAITGNGKGVGGDAISVRHHTYKGDVVGDLLGWWVEYKEF